MHDHIAADPVFRERFARETLVMARFQHPYAVTLYDASLNDPEGPCIVMEYIRGVTLDEVLRKNVRLSPGRVGRLLGQLCEVLQAAHAESIVHRDLKPSNLMIVDADSPYEMLKVMDFGLAKLITTKSQHGVAVSNAEFAVGTPGYMCPEQARGDDMDHRGDLYSVGVILYELLTGRLPFAGKSTMDRPSAGPRHRRGRQRFAPRQKRPRRAARDRGRRSVVSDERSPRPPEHRPRPGRTVRNGTGGALRRATAAAATTPTPRQIVPSRLLKPQAISQAAQQTPTPATTPPGSVNDPLAVVQTLEAWMPETIATYKLRGFINDVGGELLESVPGRIKVRLGGKGCVYNAPAPRSSFSWLGIGRRTGFIDMELRLHRPDAARESQLRITVILRSPSAEVSTDGAWRRLCGQIICDLRAAI